MKRLIILCSVVFVLLCVFNTKKVYAINCFSQMVLGEFLKQPDIAEIIDALEKIEATYDESGMIVLEKKIQMVIENKKNNFIFYYFLARIYYVRGTYYLELKPDKKRARDYYELSLTNIEKAIKFKKDFSDSYRLAGDLYGVLLDVKSNIIYGATYGSKAVKLFEKAKKYDSNNPEVYLGRGRNYLYTPLVFGGSKKRAIESFKKAIEICPTYYLGYIWLGQGYIVEGFIKEAEVCFKKALEFEPMSVWAKDEIEKIKEAQSQ